MTYEASDLASMVSLMLVQDTAPNLHKIEIVAKFTKSS